MAKQFKTLKIECATNPDWVGFFNAQDVKDEMEETGIRTPIGNDWIEYVIGHFDFPPEVDDMVANDIVTKLVCDINGHAVKFSKV